jgi:hypothetical protein
MCRIQYVSHISPVPLAFGSFEKAVLDVAAVECFVVQVIVRFHFILITSRPLGLWLTKPRLFGNFQLGLTGDGCI